MSPKKEMEQSGGGVEGGTDRYGWSRFSGQVHHEFDVDDLLKEFQSESPTKIKG